MCFIWNNFGRYITRKWVFLTAPGESSQTVSVAIDAFCRELSHPHLFPTGKFVFQTKCLETLSSTKYLDRLITLKGFQLIKTICFFFIIQKINLHSQINMAMRKVTWNKSTPGMLASDFNEKVTVTKLLLLWMVLKKPQHIGKSFYLMYWLWLNSLESQLYLWHFSLLTWDGLN